jgi:hypothetical protein
MRRRGSPLPRRATTSAASHARRAEEPRLEREDMSRVAPAEAPPAAATIRSRHEMTQVTTVASLAIGSRSVNNHDAVRPMSHRWGRRSQLYSWHMQALSYVQ